FHFSRLTPSPSFSSFILYISLQPFSNISLSLYISLFFRSIIQIFLSLPSTTSVSPSDSPPWSTRSVWSLRLLSLLIWVSSPCAPSIASSLLRLSSTPSLLFLTLPTVSSALFFNYNTSLGPPYRVLVDTNFINFSIQN
ncbi:rrna-processing protein fcf1, partial [Quercus suber]